MKHGTIKRGARAGARQRLAAGMLAKREAGKLTKVKVAELHFAFDPAYAPLKAGLCDHWRAIAGDKKKNPKTRADARERLAEAEAAWLPLLEDFRARGIVEPLQVWRRNGGGWWVKEGRNRAHGARLLGLRELPAIITREPAAAVILGTLKRGHFTKEQLAFQALSLHPYLLEREVSAGRAAKGKESHIECVIPGGEAGARFTTLADLAREIGVSVNTMSNAARVQRLVRSSEAMRAKWVPLIFTGTAGFQGILAGAGAEDAGGAANGHPAHGAAHRACGWFKSFSRRLRGEWQDIERDAEHLPELLHHLRGAALSLPPLVRGEFLAVLRDPGKALASLKKDAVAWAIYEAAYAEGGGDE